MSMRGTELERDIREQTSVWTCPLCGQKGFTFHEDRATVNLQAHIRGSDDERHGPWGKFPDRLAVGELSEIIAR